MVIHFRVLFSICFMAVILNITVLLGENFSKQSTIISTINRDMETGFEDDPDFFPVYPRITICRRPFYRTDFNLSYLHLVEYVMLSLGSPFTPLTPTEVSMLVQLAQYEMKQTANLSKDLVHFRDGLQWLEDQYQALKAEDGFDLRQFVTNHSVKCSEFFTSCIILSIPLDCCTLFEPVFTTNGLCFTTGNVKTIAQYIETMPVGFSLILDLATPPLPEQHSEWGFRIFLTDPSEEVPVVFTGYDGQDVVPGLATTIKVQLVKRKRSALHTPWHGLWDVCPRWWYNDTYNSDRYSHSICETLFYKRILEDRCKCESLFHYTEIQALRYCEPKDMYLCVLQVYLERNLSDLKTVCKTPCIVYTYKTESSYIGVGGDNQTSRVEIMYDSKQYTYHEYRKTTLSSLLSQIGGSLGLYLGASIITLMEIVTFTTTWIWYRFIPAKDNTKVHPHHTR